MDRKARLQILKLRDRIVSDFQASDWEKILIRSRHTDLCNRHPVLLAENAIRDDHYKRTILIVLHQIATRDVLDLEELEELLNQKASGLLQGAKGVGKGDWSIAEQSIRDRSAIRHADALSAMAKCSKWRHPEPLPRPQRRAYGAHGIGSDVIKSEAFDNPTKPIDESSEITFFRCVLSGCWGGLVSFIFIEVIEDPLALIVIIPLLGLPWPVFKLIDNQRKKEMTDVGEAVASMLGGSYISGLCGIPFLIIILVVMKMAN